MGIADWKNGVRLSFTPACSSLRGRLTGATCLPKDRPPSRPRAVYLCSRQIHRRICAQPTLPLPAFRVGRIMVFGKQEEAQEMVLAEDDGPTCLSNADRVDRINVGR